MGGLIVKIKIVTYNKGDKALDVLRVDETDNPEIFTTGRNISIDSSDEIYTIRETWFDIPTETLYVRVCKIGSKFDWLSGHYVIGM